MAEPMSLPNMVDKVGMRFGAGLSAVLLAVAFILEVELIVPIVAAALGIGAVFGPKHSPMSYLFRSLKAAMPNIGSEPEPASPPRFAQALGAMFLIGASIALAADATGLGWTLALVVAALQGLLAVVGLCIGCEMYVLLKRLGARGAR